MQTSPKIKTEWGKNFKTVGEWIGTDMAEYTRQDIRSLDKETNRIAQDISFHLEKVSGNHNEGLDIGGSGSNTGGF